MINGIRRHFRLHGRLLSAWLSQRIASSLAGHAFLDQLRATVVIVGQVGLDEEYPVEPDRLDALVKLFRREHHA